MNKVKKTNKFIAIKENEKRTSSMKLETDSKLLFRFMYYFCKLTRYDIELN